MESVAETVFNKFYKSFKEQGLSTKGFIKKDFGQFLDEIDEESKGAISLMTVPSGIVKTKCNFEKLLSLQSYNKSTGKVSNYLVLENGDIFTYNEKTIVTGGLTWNGDDEFYEEVETHAFLDKKVGHCDLIPDLILQKDVSSNDIEALAVDIFSIISDINLGGEQH